MNKVSGIDDDTLLRTADLAARDPFHLGEALVIPGTRTVRGPGGEADLEPRVMQVLMVLADATGTVVTRETLFQRCWGNVFVGDDSLNRAVGGVRRVAGSVAGGSFAIETVPRTGYRLNVKSGSAPVRSQVEAVGLTMSRRHAIAAAGAAAIAAGGVGAWMWLQRSSDSRFDALMAKGEDALLAGDYTNKNTVTIYEKAVRLEPGNAEAWGMLAFFCCNVREGAESAESARLTDRAKQAIDRALSIDAREPNARTSLILLEGPMLDWATRDARIREIAATSPDNIPAMREMSTLLQATGLGREGWPWNERILELAPLSRPHLIFRAMRLWILGRTSEADKVIDRVRDLWPLDTFAFYVRLMLFAMTDRPEAGLAMLDDRQLPFTSLKRIEIWRLALVALAKRSPETVETVRRAFFEAAREMPWQVNISVLVLSKLGQIDDAFELAEGYLLWRGNVISSNQSDPRALNDFNRRATPWLFTPPVAPMWADPRFLKLCDELGFVAYWRARGVKPDFMSA